MMASSTADFSKNHREKRGGEEEKWMNSTGCEVVWLHRHDDLYEEEFYMPDFSKTNAIFSKNY